MRPVGLRGETYGMNNYYVWRFLIALLALTSFVENAFSARFDRGKGIPTIRAVSASTANGTYTTGQTILITVEFSEAVVVVPSTLGPPTLTLETGALDAIATYQSGSRSRILVFSYLIRSGDVSLDLDYVSTSALSVNGGLMRDLEGNDAKVDLPGPLTGKNLASLKNLVVSTVSREPGPSPAPSPSPSPSPSPGIVSRPRGVCSEFPLPSPVPANAIRVANATELANAVRAAVGGETIALASGNYGVLTFSNRNMPNYVKIIPQEGAVPVFSQIAIFESSRWQISHVTVAPRFDLGADGKLAVRLTGSDNVFENSYINYADDISTWNLQNWLDRTGNGISFSGTRITVRNNWVKNVSHAIETDSTYPLISNNVVENFRGDGVRIWGNFPTVECNVIKNSYGNENRGDPNHDDAIQSASPGPGLGVIEGGVIRRNFILNKEDPNQFEPGNLQGVGLFNGMYRNWEIENNVIIVDSWHGITMYGSDSSRVVNNTIMKNTLSSTKTPWIQIADRQDGTPTVNTVVRNNLTPMLEYSRLTQPFASDHNLVYVDPYLHFMDPSHFDLRPKFGSSAIDVGSNTLAPIIDITGKTRTTVPDVGAYEY